jgi:hypothetical protein
MRRRSYAYVVVFLLAVLVMFRRHVTLLSAATNNCVGAANCDVGNGATVVERTTSPWGTSGGASRETTMLLTSAASSSQLTNNYSFHQDHDASQRKQDQNPTDSPPTTFTNNTSCPLAVQRAVGIYQNRSYDSTFSNVVLLTAANFEFRDILQNWERLALGHGLQWAVLALDDALYQTLGPTKAVPSGPQHEVTHVGPFRKPRYNALVCNKLRMISQIVKDCQVNVVFSDSDNVFLQDPFARPDFGKLLSSYDYLYTTNDAWTSTSNAHSCLSEGVMVEEGNTGFQYLSHTSPLLQDILHVALRRCEKPKNRRDDQYNFWKVMHGFHDEASWHHCRQEGSNQRKGPIDHKAAFSLCCLDPHYYAIGAERPWRNHSLATFHANFNQGIDEKIHKLKEWVDGGWKLSND